MNSSFLPGCSHCLCAHKRSTIRSTSTCRTSLGCPVQSTLVPICHSTRRRVSNLCQMGRAAPIFIADQFALDEGFRDTLTHLKSSRSGFRRGNLVFDFYQPLSCGNCSLLYGEGRENVVFIDSCRGLSILHNSG